VQAELAEFDRARAAAARHGFDREQVLDELRAELADWQGLPRHETGPARQTLRALFAGRLVFTPQARGRGAPYYRFSGEGTITPVIAGVAGAATGVVAPTGIARLWSPEVRGIVRRRVMQAGAARRTVAPG
jgi:hypothetical protein